MKTVALALLVAAMLPAADWKVFRSGAIDVLTDGKDAPARTALNALEQVRYLMGRWLSKPEVDPPLNVRLVVANGVGPHDWFLCRDGYLASGLSSLTLRGYAALLLDASAKRLPPEVEKGMLDVLAELKAEGPRIELGIPAKPTREWADVFYLLTNPDYAVRSRVFLSTLQQSQSIDGDLRDAASRNSLGKPWAEVKQELDAYWNGRVFGPATISGAPINPERQYRARPIETQEAERHAADAKRGTPPPIEELREAAKPDSTNAVALVAAADAEPSGRIARDMFDRAGEVAPRWAEPQVKIAALESDLARRIPRLKKAAALNPRDSHIWELLAEAQQQARLFNDAAVSYRNAEQAAATDDERRLIGQRRKEYDQEKFDLQAEEKRKAEQEKAAELERLKNEALARVHAAENKANAQIAAANPKSAKSTAAPVNWNDLNGGKIPDGKVEGRLERVDCPAKSTLISVRAGLSLIKLTADMGILVIAGTGDNKLACGVQRPARQVTIEYFAQPDNTTGTAGQAARIEFRN